MTTILEHLNYQQSAFTISDVVCTAGSVIATGQIDVVGVNDVTTLLNDIQSAKSDGVTGLTFQTLSTSPTGILPSTALHLMLIILIKIS